MSRSKELNTEPCKVCGIIIRYKGDVARHEQLHKPNDAVMFKCSYEGCTYQTLQKSNLTTHLYTHTGEKPHACPNCDYRTADPGCLTRHRKRKHAYVPNRMNGKAKASANSKQSRRHTPHKRKEIALPPSSAPAPEHHLEDLFFTLASTYGASDSSCGKMQDNRFSYTWDKSLFSLEGASTPLVSSAPLEFLPSGFSPAVDTCSQIFGGVVSPYDSMDLFPQYPQTIYPARTYLAEIAMPTFSDEDLSMIFDPAAIQAAASAIDDSTVYYSPVSSVSSPESYFFDCSPNSSCLSSSSIVADCSLTGILPSTSTASF